MKAEIHLTATGLPSLLKRLPEYTDVILKATDQALETGAWEIASEASQLAATRMKIRTGKLWSSMEAKKIAPLIWSVGSPISYAIWQERGFIHYISKKEVPGKYFLYDAFYNNMRRVKELIINYVDFSLTIRGV